MPGQNANVDFNDSFLLLAVQELCRQHMASKSSLCRQDCVAGGSMAGSAMPTGAGGRRGTDTSRVSSVSSQFSDGPQHSPSSTHSSTPSWSEEPAQSNMDISTGHMILVSASWCVAQETIKAFSTRLTAYCMFAR